MISKINTIFRVLAIILLILHMLSSCGALQYRPVKGKDYPPEPEKRIKKNMEEGRGIRIWKNRKKGGTFDFASSNALWRASLDTISFMPLLTADYGGGIIITDWFNSTSNENQSNYYAKERWPIYDFKNRPPKPAYYQIARKNQPQVEQKLNVGVQR